MKIQLSLVVKGCARWKGATDYSEQGGVLPTNINTESVFGWHIDGRCWSVYTTHPNGHSLVILHTHKTQKKWIYYLTFEKGWDCITEIDILTVDV